MGIITFARIVITAWVLFLALAFGLLAPDAAGASVPAKPVKKMRGYPGNSLSFPPFPCAFTIEIYDRTGGGMVDRAIISMDMDCVRKFELDLKGGSSGGGHR